MVKQSLEITQQFTFDAAHYLGAAPTDSNRRIHGHSFYVDVTLRGEPDPGRGWVRDFAEINRVLGEIRDSLDHRMLNDLPEIGMPTLENLARFIFREIKRRLPETCRIRISRPSLGQSCMYEQN
jgi:6-pyruvoyltetrahydropterin/6-carboxytetrahydropterin synthase